MFVSTGLGVDFSQLIWLISDRFNTPKRQQRGGSYGH
jgi:hypothetical protein